MKNIVVLGAGTAGTMLVNRLMRYRHAPDMNITVIDKNDHHDYQPGYLFVPFAMMPARRITHSRKKYLPDGARFIESEVTRIDTGRHFVELSNGDSVAWDQLVITTGTTPRPDLIPGMGDGALWHSSVFDFYTLEGAQAAKPAVQGFMKGRLVVHVTEMPIKCPVAPIEFALLAQDFMRKRGRTKDVDIVFVTPLDGPFTKPVASKRLGRLFAERGIELVTDFQIESIDNDSKELVSYDGRRVPFDLAITVPPNQGADFVRDSGLADSSGFVEVDKYTLQSIHNPDVWAAGDASNVPTSKAGSVAHFQMDALVPNLIAHINGQPLPEIFDGHANCFIESGRGQAMLLDFNYDVEPLPGLFPIFHVPSLRLLGASSLNHAAKMAFEGVYWQMLIKGLPLPFPAHMSMEGKKLPEGMTLPDTLGVPTIGGPFRRLRPRKAVLAPGSAPTHTA